NRRPAGKPTLTPVFADHTIEIATPRERWGYGASIARSSGRPRTWMIQWCEAARPSCRRARGERPAQSAPRTGAGSLVYCQEVNLTPFLADATIAVAKGTKCGHTDRNFTQSQ